MAQSLVWCLCHDFDLEVAVRYSEGTIRFCADVRYSSKKNLSCVGFLCNMPMERGLCSWNFVADNPRHINTVKVETCFIDTRTPIYFFLYAYRLYTDYDVFLYTYCTYSFVLIVYAYVRLSCVVRCPHLKDPDFQNYMIYMSCNKSLNGFPTAGVTCSSATLGACNFRVGWPVGRVLGAEVMLGMPFVLNLHLPKKSE